MMQLNFKVFGDGLPLIILHGMLGSLDNWQTMAKAFATSRKVYILDARNHGKSPHVNDISYPLMADDLLEFMQQQGIQIADLLGHSMGGKTVMEFTQQHAEMVNHLIVADIAPKAYPPHHDDIFAALFAVDLDTIMDRQEADDIMSSYIEDASMRQFLLKNLDRKENGGYQWKMNLGVFYQHYSNITAGIELLAPVANPTLVLRGAQSGYIKLGDIDLFKQYFPNTQMITFEKAGHWLHADEPKAFFNAVEQFLLTM